jgi:TPP-dependent 2-oxoacid decarboxylase
MKFKDPANPNADYLSDPEALATAVKDILHLINVATKPVLIGGVKLRKCGAAEDYMELASKMQCALGITPDAKSLIAEDHPCYIGCWWGSVSSAHVQETVESSDLVLFAGAIFNDYTTVGWTSEIPESKSIRMYHDHVNICGRHIANVYMHELIKALVPSVPIKEASLVTYHRYKDGDFVPAVPPPTLEFTGQEQPLTLQYISSQIQSNLTSETSLVIETGDCWFIGQNLHLPRGSNYHVQMQYGSIGWAVGATLGVAMAVGAKRKVMALIGDGSFQVISCCALITTRRT